MRTQALGVTQKFLEANPFITIHIEFFLFENRQSIFRGATCLIEAWLEGHDGEIKRAATFISKNCRSDACGDGIAWRG